MKKPQIIGLNKLTKRRMKKRKMWRTRSLETALSLAAWPVGSPREEIKRQMEHDFEKIKHWFGERRSGPVIRAIQRRSIEVWRNR